ncbi:hypothetical protein H107_08183 [Trichophyton rubrum CBS 202.88]|nr:hypothetical protein H107_08183 [Trichophyton rubrum CBS 202.88]
METRWKSEDAVRLDRDPGSSGDGRAIKLREARKPESHHHGDFPARRPGPSQAQQPMRGLLVDLPSHPTRRTCSRTSSCLVPAMGGGGGQ